MRRAESDTVASPGLRVAFLETEVLLLEHDRVKLGGMEGRGGETPQEYEEQAGS